MLTCCVQKISLFTRRSTLAVKIKRLRATVMILYTLCARARTLCVFSGDSFKCSECTCKGVICDGNFSKTDFDKLLKEKDYLEATWTRAIIEVASLDKRIKAL
jgi:hypothetical protein